MAFKRQSASPLPETRVSASPPVHCPRRVSRPVLQSFAQVVCLGQSASSLPRSRVSASLPVLCPRRVSRPVCQSFARDACLGQFASSLPGSHVSASPLLTYLDRFFARTVYLTHLNFPYGPGATSARGLSPRFTKRLGETPLGGGRMIGYPMGQSDSSKSTPDGQPRQHFGGSHVSPRDQVGSRSGIRGGGDRVRHYLAPCPLM
ncbi:hypothetical protein BHM03_00022971 [Ensete ventricosum]|uniref:Uncharacterized protein n=1 Tax=Ensete ventricosum TaxID=4639 RepID=A0A445MGI6_ENSVE|nr:hypothetical protein BHM03_00022971 [Ensete ventricosum]